VLERIFSFFSPFLEVELKSERKLEKFRDSANATALISGTLSTLYGALKSFRWHTFLKLVSFDRAHIQTRCKEVAHFNVDGRIQMP
jgi:hypothetical protein